MELFFKDLSYQANLADVQHVFAQVLHSPQYLLSSRQPWNFSVRLFPPKAYQPGKNHGGCGIVTLPQKSLGQLLLLDPNPLYVKGRKIKLDEGKREPRPDILHKLRHEPYVSPGSYEAREAKKETFEATTVGINTLQFGWEVRGGAVYSVEWEKRYDFDCHLAFGDERREIRIKLFDEQSTVRSIGIHWSQISWTACGSDNHPVVFLSLSSPPTFDQERSSQTLLESLLHGRSPVEKRQRLLALYPEDKDHVRVLPYTTLAIRLICNGVGDVKRFKELCKLARLPAPKDFLYHAEALELFSEARLRRYHEWIARLDWPVAFQLEALHRGRLADTKEMLSIRDIVSEVVATQGASYATGLLRSVANDVGLGLLDGSEPLRTIILRYTRDPPSVIVPPSLDPADGVFNCLHVSITPTATKLEGPLPERSNRVLRTYAANHDSFIRVSFIEETDLRYQHDRETDGPAFVNSWVLPILRNGIHIANRHFRFLAYSQSALKTHTVWFVKEFKGSSGQLIAASTIIKSLGNFGGLTYDPNLMYCPARYAARISQSFTTTDSSISVPAEEIFVRKDIMSNCGRWSFTDGVGSISPELARGIWKVLQKKGSRSTRRTTTYPRAFQIRLSGAKGMISVDYRLTGRVVVLRQSMIKFDAPGSTDVEIAQAFIHPIKFYLNRPLIMILEGLGIPYSVFKRLQTAAIRDVNEAADSLVKAANTLDQYGLATSYRLSSTLLHLARLDITPSLMDDFYDQMLGYSIHHILRDLKHHARIPVRDGYTLAGIADVHGYLREGDVFACVTDPETYAIRYLEGRILVSRSPTIHPGDVQVVHAIGQPPPGTPFDKEPLMNTVVFPVKGARPLPSYLGGGDLDGDLYNVTTFKDLLPELNFPPAEYIPAPKKLLDRPSTMDDVADFVADYISSDILGMVAINWLLIADLDNIYHADCIKLCQVHSNAVDYPKSGTPVSISDVPKPEARMKPDWHAPETVDLDGADNFYPSQKAIGRLFRAVDLPAVQTHSRATRQQRRHLHGDLSELDLDDVFAALCLEDATDDPIEVAVETSVAQHISIEPHSKFVTLAIASLDRYSINLQGVCTCNALPRHKTATLTEAEAVIGTIIAKCSQRRRRREAIAQLREHTGYLVKAVRAELAGDEDTSLYDWLASSYAAWKVSLHFKTRFGSSSYGLIALGEIFDAVKAIEQDTATGSHRSRGR
ncbi:RdRP-domain-containing protein [Gloeopeniophorella convolvens]|nr:RdRP-domain-containing protein [Gloeopeniophorella convolvens]